MKTAFIRRSAAASLSLLLAAAGPFNVLADTNQPDQAYTQEEQRLQDGQLDYDKSSSRRLMMQPPQKGFPKQ